MALPDQMPPLLLEYVAQRFRTLGDPTRLRIVDLLRDGERSAGELVGELDTTQQNVSKHLNNLRAAGIVDRRREGNRAIYRIADRSVLDLCEHVCGSFERRVAELREVVEAGARG